MIVAITGGTGFIGRKLVARLLARGDTVRLLSRNPAVPDLPSAVQLYQCDLLSAQQQQLAAILDGVDVLCHCAGQLTAERAMRALHIDATRRLAAAASGRIAHWVQLSSVGVYGPVHEGMVTEDTALSPAGEYEVTKAGSELIAIEGADRGKYSYSVLRPSTVYGAGMSNQSLFGMIRMVDRGWFFCIGKPGASANYIHVDNVAEALIRCATMTAARGRTYNLSDRRSWEEMAAAIAAALGRAAPRLRLPQPIASIAAATLGRLPGFPLTPTRVAALTSRCSYPVTRIEQELEYHHVISMEDGLRELVRAYLGRNRSVTT